MVSTSDISLNQRRGLWTLDVLDTNHKINDTDPSPNLPHQIPLFQLRHQRRRRQIGLRAGPDRGHGSAQQSAYRRRLDRVTPSSPHSRSRFPFPFRRLMFCFESCRMAAVMILGALLSATITPETCEASTGKTLALSDTALRRGRQRLAFQQQRRNQTEEGGERDETEMMQR